MTTSTVPGTVAPGVDDARTAVWRSFGRNPVGVGSLVVLAFTALVAVAAPVRIGRGGQVVAAISSSGATARISHADVERFARLLVAEGESVSARLRGRGRGRGGAAGSNGSRDGGRDTEGVA